MREPQLETLREQVADLGRDYMAHRDQVQDYEGLFRELKNVLEKRLKWIDNEINSLYATDAKFLERSADAKNARDVFRTALRKFHDETQEALDSYIKHREAFISALRKRLASKNRAYENVHVEFGKLRTLNAIEESVSKSDLSSEKQSRIMEQVTAFHDTGDDVTPEVIKELDALGVDITLSGFVMIDPKDGNPGLLGRLR